MVKIAIKKWFGYGIVYIVMVLCHASPLFAQGYSASIRVNQVGFLPNAVKIAAIVNSQTDSFKIITYDQERVVFAGKLSSPSNYPSSGEQVRIADFSSLLSPGKFRLLVEGLGKSVPFSISEDLLLSLSKASIKAFYYNRASTPLLKEHAGIYARAAGHPDNSVIVHPSAASVGRPAGTVLSTPGGWYDAGDYNKYIVNSGISVFTLLSAYETYPEYYDTLKLNIPESDNPIPDILDEALWNIRWMMTMQDSADGGVYNKTTEAQFSAFVMPAKATSTRYVVAKGTAATLDFAAIMAMTARIYKPFDPVLSEKALQQALKAWDWAKANPTVQFNNPSASGAFPAIGTGGYGDTNFADEFSWCAAELFISTKVAKYYNEIGLNKTYDIPGWPNVKTLGLLSLIVNKDELNPVADTTLAESKLIGLVNQAKNKVATSPYHIPGDYFYWGGNNVYANLGILFMQAFRITRDITYFNAALSSLDYLLGRNATSYCFVTGAGTKRPMNIHHRVSGADGIAEPIPGFLVGGPNPSNVSDCGAPQYPSSLPAKAYADLECSYSTNEVAINWNAPLAFLAGAIQCEYLGNFKTSAPVTLMLSPTRITLPSKSGYESQLIIEGNAIWSLSSDKSWISFAPRLGTGNAVVKVSCTADNTSEAERSGCILVYSGAELYDSIWVTQNGRIKNFRIEAENYIEMYGLQTEATSDEQGGLNIGYVDPGDWASYQVEISHPGIYGIEVRHAGYTGEFDLSIDGIEVKKVTLPATSDWQVWTQTSFNLDLKEGLHLFKLKFNKAGTNINWISFVWKESSGMDLTPNGGLRIYPLPADRILTVDCAGASFPDRLNIISTSGNMLLKRDFNGDNRMVIDVSDLKSGVYLMQIECKSGISNHRIMKK